MSEAVLQRMGLVRATRLAGGLGRGIEIALARALVQGAWPWRAPQWFRVSSLGGNR